MVVRGGRNFKETSIKLLKSYNAKKIKILCLILTVRRSLDCISNVTNCRFRRHFETSFVYQFQHPSEFEQFSGWLLREYKDFWRNSGKLIKTENLILKMGSNSESCYILWRIIWNIGSPVRNIIYLYCDSFIKSKMLNMYKTFKQEFLQCIYIKL